MRLKTIFIPLAAFLIAALACVFAARTAVAVVEERSVLGVREALADQDHVWASVLGDGLQIIIEGEAPSEAIRFRAISIAGGVVDASRVIDNMHVAEREAIAPPNFKVEILRNAAGISLIGLVPLSTDRDALTADLARIAGDAPVTDLLEIADYPVPEGWERALEFAVESLEQLPRSKISVEAGHVSINAITGNETDQRILETDLSRAAPNGVRLSLAVTAPRPVITPFTVRFALDEAGARFEACSADTEATQRQIIAAAFDAGAEGRLSCRLGLGVPTATWGDAVEMAIGAVAEMGGGTVTFADADIALVAPSSVDAETFDRVVGELSNALPDVFALDATLTPLADAQPAGPPQFTATLSPEGTVRLQGRVPDELMNTTVQNFSEARFGADKVVMGTRIVEGLPRGWSVRVLAGLDALSRLGFGVVTVEPDMLSVRGSTGDTNASDEISALMLDKLGSDADFRVEVTYDEELDPLSSQPTPQECVAEIISINDTRKINFDAGSATLTAEARPIVDDIAEVLRLCPDLELEIAGYTDSQGGEDGNQRLSQQRADAVLEALRARRVPVGAFIAIGYGEEQPIADNETAAGREANRRIEFRLVAGSEPEAEEILTVDGDPYPFDPDVGGAFADGESPGKRPRLRPDEISAEALAAIEAAAEAAENGE